MFYHDVHGAGDFSAHLLKLSLRYSSAVWQAILMCSDFKVYEEVFREISIQGVPRLFVHGHSHEIVSESGMKLYEFYL